MEITENTEELKPEDDFPVSEQPDEPTAPEPEKRIPVGSESRWQRFKNWYRTDKKKSIPLSVLALVVLVFIIPWSRYHTAGLVLKKNFTVQVLDSTAGIPVSGADVSTGSASGVTDGNGRVTLHGVKVGAHKFGISKKYYQDKSASFLVPIFGQKTTPKLSFIATGRQVKIVVTDLINDQKLSNVEIKLADIKAKTDKNGTALIVLPVGTKSQKTTLTLKNYNDSQQTVTVSDRVIKENDLKMTPTGKIYFLSKRTGKLNVMKANLDSSGTEVVVAGTGSEQDFNTFLVQSGNGQYVAVIAKRNAADPAAQLYVLAAENDKLLQIDSGNADFNILGWVGNSLIYTTARKDLPVWQPGLNKLKSYDASSGKTTPLDQSAGSTAEIGGNETYILTAISGSSVVYGKVWNGSSDLVAKQNSLQVIDADGQNHKTVASYSIDDSIYFTRHKPDSFYVWVHSPTTKSDTYWQYSVGSVAKQINITNDQFYADQFSYFFSPSGNQSVWSERRDGKITVLVGDNSGANSKAISTGNDYGAYGWYGDKYVLVSKAGSQLYIMDAKGGTPVKVADYQAGGY